MHIFPTTTGPYSVSTTCYNWVDENRIDIFSSNSLQKRRLIVQIWYPSISTKNDQSNNQYAYDIVNEWKDGLKNSGFPEKDIPILDSLVTHASFNTKLLKSDTPYPIILFSHGYVALRTAYTTYCEELASHGFIVVGIGHTYYTQISKFDNGDVVFATPEHSSQSSLLLENDSIQEQDIWLADVKFVIAMLEKLHNTPSESNIFYEHLDLDTIGMFGHSFGGSTAVQACRTDDRIKAAIDLDGGLFGPNATTPFEKPVMFIVGSDSFNAFTNYSDEDIAVKVGFSPALVGVLRQKYYQYIPQLFRALDRSYMVIIDQAKHAAFSDWVVLKDLPLYQNNKHIFNLENLTGTINGTLMIEIVNFYLVSFFNAYLKQKSMHYAIKSPYKGVVVRMHDKI